MYVAIAMYIFFFPLYIEEVLKEKRKET